MKILRKKNMSKIIVVVSILIILVFIFISKDDTIRKAYRYDDTDNIYYNYLYGFQYYYTDFEIDNSLEYIKTVFKNDDIEISIFYDNFENTVHSQRAYTSYSNKYIKDSDYINIDKVENFKHRGYNISLIQWHRKKLKHITSDFNYYASIEVLLNNNEVYTIYAKSSKTIDYKDILDRFSLVEIKKDIKLNPINIKNNLNKKHFNERAFNYYNESIINSNTLEWGIFEPTTIKALDKLKDIEEVVQYDFKYILEYYSLYYDVKIDHLNELADNNKILEFTLQTTIFGDFNQNIVYELLDGKHDEELNKIFLQLKNMNQPILFRLNNEMNGDWCQYNALYFCKDTYLYTELWKYIFNIAQEHSIDNMIWVWNPNWGDFPGFKWNHYLNYFPGEEYVDIIGATGYNTGDYYEGEIWREFDEIYEPMMKEYNSIFEYPFMITEFSCSDYGGNKDLWIKDMFENIKKYNFKIAIWFNGIDYDGNGNPARIYTMDHETKYLDIFKDYIND